MSKTRKKLLPLLSAVPPFTILLMITDSPSFLTVAPWKCTNESKLSHSGWMDLSIIISWMSPLSFLGVFEVIFNFCHIFSMKVLFANRIAQDGTPSFVASHLGYTVCICPINRDIRLIRVN